MTYLIQRVACCTLLTASLLGSVQADEASSARLENFLSQPQSEQLHWIADTIRAEDWDRVNEKLAPCLIVDSNHPALEWRCTRLYSDLVMTDDAYLQAIDHWATAEPENYHRHLFKAQLLSHQAFEELSFDFPKRAPPYHQHRAQQQRQQGRAELEAALAQYPHLPYAYGELIRNLRWTGDADQLSRLNTEAMAQVPWSVEVAKAILSNSMTRGDSDFVVDASNAWDVYRNLEPRFPQLAALRDYQRLLEANAFRGGNGREPDLPRALTLLKQLAAEGYDDLFLYTSLVNVHSTLNQPRQARAALEKAQTIAPDNVQVLTMAHCPCSGFSYPESIQAAQSFTRRIPTSFVVWSELGKLNVNYQQYEPALDAFEQALSIRPYDPTTNLRVQVIKEALGIEYNDFRTRDYYIGLVLYSVPGNLFVDDLAELVRTQWPASQGTELDRAIDDFFTAKALERRVLESLNRLEWTDETWEHVSAFLAMRSNMGSHLQPEYRQQLQQRFPTLEGDHEVGQVMAIYHQERRAMLTEFVDRYQLEKSTDETA